MKPAEFWKLTLSDYNLMVHARLEQMQYERNVLAAHAQAIMVYGRAKNPNARTLLRPLTGRKKLKFDDETTQKIYKQSTKRAKKGIANGNA